MATVPAVPEVIGALQLTTQALQRMARVLPTWEEEHLIEFFRNCAALQNGSYYAQCLVAHILYERYSQNAAPAEARRQVARVLQLAPFTVYEMVAAWDRIFAELGVEDYVLPMGFYQKAIRAEKYGVDPVEAVRYAAHRRQVLGQNYRISDFARDIRVGLPEPESSSPQSTEKSCRKCQYLQTAPAGAVLWLMVPDQNAQGTPMSGWFPLAGGNGEGQRFCQVRAKLAAELMPYGKTAAECPDYKERA